MEVINGTFDPRTLAMLKAVFEEASGLLPPHRRTPQVQLDLASCILNRAAQGGVTSAQLRAYALMKAAVSAAKLQSPC